MTSSGATINLSLDIDSGLCNVSFRCKNNVSGGCVLLNVGYFVTIISSSFHNNFSKAEVASGSTCGNINLVLTASGLNGAVLRYVASECSNSSIERYSW